MGLFPHSFRFQMDSLYISWQLPRYRKEKRGEKSLGQREHARGGVAWSAELRRTEWKTFPFLSLSVFMHPLFPHPGSKPWTFEKERKKEKNSLIFPRVVCNNVGCVTVERLCIHWPSSSLRARDLPPASFLDTSTETNQHSQREEEV